MNNEKLNLHQRIVRIMDTMGAVGKGGKTSYGDKFAYHKIDDIDDKLRGALVEHGVVATISSIKDRKLENYQGVDKYGNARTEWYAECLIEIELVNADNPADRSVIVGWGQGLDYSDKATGKAMSYAAKSAYLSAFHLRGQPDNEEDNIPKTPNLPKLTQQEPEVTEVMQSWIDSMNQCDSFESFARMEVKLKKESSELFEALDGWRQQAAIRCLTQSVETANNLEELANLAEVLRRQPEAIQKPLRVAYSKRVKELKQGA